MPSTSDSKLNTSTVKKVFVGLSGGVDSAVSAALLKQQGYDVTGVFIRIALPGYPCSAGADRIDAMRVAAHLKIPFLEIDLSKEYEREVFRPSIEGFREGQTPNPDALCNLHIKFGAFFKYARAAGADAVATGHYAQTRDGLLYAGADENKDQSYFLWSVSEDILRRTLFPVGAMRKDEVRNLAHSLGLPNAGRPDSQGLCFLGPISIEDMLERELTLKKGAVMSEEGAVVGEHEGAARFTLGQRHGFRLFSHTPDTQPHFVIAKDINENTITVSTNRFPTHARETEVTLSQTNWIGEVPVGSCMARFRYRQQLISASPQGATITLHEPYYVPVGQSLVLYDGERCVGGGIIEKAELKS